MGRGQRRDGFRVQHAAAGDERNDWNTRAFRIETSADAQSWSAAVSVRNDNRERERARPAARATCGRRSHSAVERSDTSTLTYSLLPTVDRETPALTVTVGQQLLPFGLEMPASEELKPIRNAEFTTNGTISAFGLTYQFVVAKDTITAGKTLADPLRRDVTAHAHTATFFRSFGESW